MNQGWHKDEERNERKKDQGKQKVRCTIQVTNRQMN